MKIELNKSDYLPEIELKCKKCNEVKHSYHIHDVVDEDGKSVCCQGNTSTYALKWIHRHLMTLSDTLTEEQKEQQLKNYTTIVTV